MTLRSILRALGGKRISHFEARQRIRRAARRATPIFEMMALEQRMLLSVGQPQDVTAIAPGPTFPPPAATVHPMSQIDLSWQDPTQDAVSFNISYSTDGINFIPAGSVPGGTTTFTVDNLNPGTNYEFDVQAVGSDNSTNDAFAFGSTSPGETDYINGFQSSEPTEDLSGGTLETEPANAANPGTQYYEANSGSTVALNLSGLPYHTLVDRAIASSPVDLTLSRFLVNSCPR